MSKLKRAGVQRRFFHTLSSDVFTMIPPPAALGVWALLVPLRVNEDYYLV